MTETLHRFPVEHGIILVEFQSNSVLVETIGIATDSCLLSSDDARNLATNQFTLQYLAYLASATFDDSLNLRQVNQANFHWQSPCGELLIGLDASSTKVVLSISEGGVQLPACTWRHLTQILIKLSDKCWTKTKNQS